MNTNSRSAPPRFGFFVNFASGIKLLQAIQRLFFFGNVSKQRVNRGDFIAAIAPQLFADNRQRGFRLSGFFQNL